MRQYVPGGGRFGFGEEGGKSWAVKCVAFPQVHAAQLAQEEWGGGRGETCCCWRDAGLVGYYVVKGAGQGKKDGESRRSSPLGGWGVSAQFAPRMFISADGMDMREPVSENDG